MLGVSPAYVDTPAGVDPVVLAVAAVSVATAVGDISVAKSALELGGTDALDVGDLLVAVPKANSTTATWVSKVGDPAFTLDAQNNTTCSAAVLHRIVDGSEGANFTFTRSSSTAAAELDVWRIKAGTFDPAHPIDVCGFIAASGDLTILSIATTVARTLLCQSVARLVSLTGQSWTPPPGVTELYDTIANTNNLQVAGGTKQLVAAGATGDQFWDQTGTGTVRGTMFAVRSKP